VKPVLAWVKSNLVIVIALAVAIIAIPVCLVFSSKMNAKLRNAVQQDVSSVLGQLNGLSVDYAIPAPSPAETAWTLRSAPNQLRNQAVERELAKLTAQSEGVRSLAIERNKGDKRLLIPSTSPENTLFPAPANESARVRLLTEMTEKWLEAHATLLKDARAGTPPSAEELFTQLESRRTRLTHERVSGRVKQELEPEEQADIARQLAQERLSAYRAQAQRITFYADPSVFRNVEPWPADRGVPKLEQAWEWQWEYWINQDIIAALAKANAEPGVPWKPVNTAPVKRILEIDVAPFGLNQSTGDTSGGRGRGGAEEEGGGAAPASPDPSAPIEPNYSVSPTGRAGWPDVPNGLYDVRYATVTIVVDINRLPKVLDAIATTNFMSVVDVDVRAFDRQGDLAQGYFYGDAPLAIATIKIETIWIRSWMKPWMPESVRTELGIPADAPASEEQHTDA